MRGFAIATCLVIFAVARADMPAEGFREADPAELDDGAGPGMTEPPLGEIPAKAEVDARTETFAARLRCPVCQGLSVAASQSPAARAMRERIRNLVASGYTDEQITQYFVDRYGTWVLLEPPAQGLTWLLWVAPAAAVLLGLGGISLRAMRRRPAPPPDASPAPKAGDIDPYRARILAEVEGAAPTKRGESP